MSSAKYPLKRVGYLGAVQSFRPDTEVLMLATNLLKKDMVSPAVSTMSLPLLTLPHIISPSLGLSLLTDVLPRLSHSNPAVRKKAVVNLYRISLVYPEAFRIAWPKIKERLMDDQEDSSVTAAVINVVCELGWRRPQDFLPLAPRLFDLLVDGGNNWMAIKIIKLFATLTPLEPRLVRKLLRPLLNIIQTTTAMSLLYECINGVIQGGILENADGVREGEEIANLCVEKLRGMIVMEGDPNLKYVALLAFNRIVASHATLVAMQQDVIMDCLDDNDISIRLQALELVCGMVTSDSLHTVVTRLITQLQTSPATMDDAHVSSTMPDGLTPSADIDGDDPEEQLHSTHKRNESVLALPNHYRNEVLHRILDICSRDTYSSIVDFEWYVEVLVQLVRLVPPRTAAGSSEFQSQKGGVAVRIGYELRNVAVRVKSVRPEATRAAESLVLMDNRAILFPAASAVGADILEFCAWIVGEYAEYLEVPDRTFTSLIHPSNISLPSAVLSSYLQAIPKVFISLTTKFQGWDSSRQSEVSLLLARVTDFLEKLSSHPDLDVQERAIEFLELLRLTAEAILSQDADCTDAPLLLSSAIPSLFTGLELNPVAVGAQAKVPLPENLDLDKPLNDRLHHILKESENDWLGASDQGDLRDFYYTPETASTKLQSYTKESTIPNTMQPSYQNMPDDFAEKAEAKDRRRAERRDRNRDDPFYIAYEEGSSGTSTPFHQVLRTSNGEELDIDSIPIIDLAIESSETTTSQSATRVGERPPKKAHSKRKKVEILGDETITITDERAASTAGVTKTTATTGKPKIKRSLLEVDSSGLSSLSLEEPSWPGGPGPAAPALSIHDIERREAEEAEMATAMREIERLRLEMQRAAERVQAPGVPPEGTLVKRKKKKKKKKKDQDDPEAKEAKAQMKTKKRQGKEGGVGSNRSLTPSATATGGTNDPAISSSEVGGGGIEVEVKRKKKKQTSSSSKKKKDTASASASAAVAAAAAAAAGPSAGVDEDLSGLGGGI
ncbi:AP-3 complex subunit delta [Histoplasma capsulatum]|uniref:AP-3 complex subunit delta n=2 Tax=Histoplasma TaxID=5036 RepID=A0A8A1M767_AJECA|nr:AP-3 complex subunit delta [Histoplasma capsulatum]